MSSDSVIIDNSIGPNYIMYVNFHLQISMAWTSPPTASHCAVPGSQGPPSAHPPPPEEGALGGLGARMES